MIDKFTFDTRYNGILRAKIFLQKYCANFFFLENGAKMWKILIVIKLKTLVIPVIAKAQYSKITRRVNHL